MGAYKNSKPKRIATWREAIIKDSCIELLKNNLSLPMHAIPKFYSRIKIAEHHETYQDIGDCTPEFGKSEKDPRP